MRIKKKNEDEGLTPEQELERKVDAMMDLHVDETATKKAEAAMLGEEVEENTPDASEPEIDIFKDTKTAPVLETKETKKAGKHKKIEPLHPDELKKEIEESAAEAAEATEPESEEPEEQPEEPAEQPEEATPETEAPEVDDAEEKPAEASAPLSDAQTDEVIDEITKEDSDKLLELEDEDKQVTPAHHHKGKQEGRSFKQKFGDFFRAWWQNKWARGITIFIVTAGLIGLAIWPTSRYFILNTAGVRSSASLKVVDGSTGLPLKNVRIQLGTLQAKTNADGQAKFTMVRLGKQQLVVERVAFARIDKQIVIGWGSNPLGDMGLKATGAQYVFEVRDYLSNKAVKAEAVSGEANAVADKDGKIILTVEDPEGDTLEVKVRADEYRTEELKFAADTKDVFNLRMVPAQPVVYVTKMSGKYDLYKVDVDGKNKELLLEGTGRERQNIGVSMSPDGTRAALVSSRGTKRDSAGYLLDVLTLIDLKSKKTTTLDEAQSIRAIDWVGPRLIYTVTYAAPSAATGDRQKIISYNTEESARSVLANSDYFNGIVSAQGYVYYAIASSDPKQAAAFTRIRVDGSGKQTILNKQVWVVQRSDLKKLSLQTPEGWYDYTIGSSSAQKGTPPDEAFAGRQYVADKSGSKHLWVEGRDGKGVLIVRDERSSKKDTMLVSASGVSMPARWLSSNTIVYRVNNSNEIADYVKNIEGGEAQKISDVTPTFGPSSNY